MSPAGQDPDDEEDSDIFHLSVGNINDHSTVLSQEILIFCIFTPKSAFLNSSDFVCKINSDKWTRDTEDVRIIAHRDIKLPNAVTSVDRD